MKSTLWKIVMAVAPVLLISTAFGAEKAAEKAEEKAAPKVEAKEAPKPEFEMTPMLRFVDVSGNKQQFREDWWIRDGFTGGVEDFSMRQEFGKNSVFTLQGHGIYSDEDYMVRMEFNRPDLGFIRAGFSQYRKWFNDTGGYYPFFTVPSFELDRDLNLTVGNWFVEAGLTKPGFPKITFGFEHQSKEGDKSMLEWGSVIDLSAGALNSNRKIYPAFKDIDETVDIFKINVDHDIGKVHLADQFRYENYNNDTTRYEREINLTASTSKNITIREDFNHDQFSNALSAESHITDKLYASGGYLFATMNGGADLSINTVTTPPGVFVASPFNYFWTAQAMQLDQDSHVLNANLMYGPWAGLTAYAGVQAEQTQTDGAALALLTQVPPQATPEARLLSATDKSSLTEHAGVRFTKIPFTVLFAEGRMVQQQIDLTNSQLGGDDPFARRTDTDVERHEYVVGFNTSPIRRAGLSAEYRRSERENDYNHFVDTTVGGYPGFIDLQQFDTDQINAKLTLRPMNRFTTTFKYQLISTDIRTRTDAAPGNSITSGEYNAHIYSVSATVTPINRLYLTGYFSLTDSETTSFANGVASVTPFENRYYTLMTTIGYALDEKTDASVDYLHSRTFSFNGSYATGMPYGFDNTRHGVSAGLARRITKNMTARLRYGYYELDQPTDNHINDYQAHLAMLTCTVRF